MRFGGIQVYPQEAGKTQPTQHVTYHLQHIFPSCPLIQAIYLPCGQSRETYKVVVIIVAAALSGRRRIRVILDPFLEEVEERGKGKPM